MKEVNLTNCDLEPIHIPGSVQSHGVLLAVDEFYEIRYCSENVSAIFGINADELLGNHISNLNIFDNFDGSDWNHILRSGLGIDIKAQQSSHSYHFKGDRYQVSINQSANYRLIDIEPATEPVSVETQTAIGRSLSEILADKSLDRILTNAARNIRALTGFDRVMIYKFHSDGHGEVVAEERADQLESWMGLHYPASDIPKQARDLYKVNLVRLIADVESKPSNLLSSAFTDKPLDLTNSSLRAVSPVHIQYLKNMGVRTSFSISIVDEGRLWGLVACHHYTKNFIDHTRRQNALLIGQVLSSAIGFREKDEFHALNHKYAQSLDTLTRDLLRNVPVVDTLISGKINMKDIIDSTGAALYFEGTLSTIGKVPPKSFLSTLVDWLDKVTSEELCFTSNHLSSDFPASQPHAALASGILACRLDKDLKEYLIWFRPETVTTVRWAGNPRKTEHIAPNGMLHINPRNSFLEWSELVIGSAKKWEEHELSAATSLKDELILAISRKSIELRAIHEKLRLAYSELDTFSYTIAHDLKNPLASIKAFAQLIARGKLDHEKMLSLAQRIDAGADKMKHMIDEVLSYSKIGQAKIEGNALDMYDMISEIRSDLISANENPDLKIIVGHTPALYGDRMMLLQVFSNIIGNAVKYSSKTTSPTVKIQGSNQNDQVVYEISDNGIGINKEDSELIFDLFSRATGSQEFEGTGVGLAIAKRIVERHNGNISVKSEIGQGSIFKISFKQAIYN